MINMRNTKFIIIVAAFLLLAIAKVGAQGTTSGNSGCGLVSGPAVGQLSTTEPWYCPINQQIYNQWTPYLGLTGIVIFLSFAIAGIIFMIGVALKNDRIRNFGVGEFYEAIATLIIVAAFLYLCAVVFGLWPGSYVGTINPYATSFDLMTKTLAQAEQMYSTLFNAYFDLAYSISPSIEVNFGGAFGATQALLNFIGYVPQIFININALTTQAFFLNPAQAIAGFLTDGITALYAEYYLLVFFSISAIPVFLIPGVFFRAIFPTRAVGGILIALAFGFFLIMPALFSVAYYFTSTTVQRDMGVATLQLASLPYTSQSVSSQSSPLVEQLRGIGSSLNGFWLMIFFYPGLIMAMTYAAVREIANFIGRASSLSGQVRRFI
jgi:hypothetical protein